MCPHIKITLRAEIRWNHVASRAFPLRGLGDPVLGRSCEDNSACKATVRKTQPLAGKLWRVDMMPGAGPTPELHQQPPYCPSLLPVTAQPDLSSAASDGWTLFSISTKGMQMSPRNNSHLVFLPIFPLSAVHLRHKLMCRNGDISCSFLGQVYCVSSGMALPSPKN